MEHTNLRKMTENSTTCWRLWVSSCDNLIFNFFSKRTSNLKLIELTVNLNSYPITIFIATHRCQLCHPQGCRQHIANYRDLGRRWWNFYRQDHVNLQELWIEVQARRRVRWEENGWFDSKDNHHKRRQQVDPETSGRPTSWDCSRVHWRQADHNMQVQRCRQCQRIHQSLRTPSWPTPPVLMGVDMTNLYLQWVGLININT